MMTMADFGQPILDLPRIAGGFDASSLARRDYRATFDTDAGLAAAEFLLELLSYSPSDILSMSWYERIRPYAAGTVPMAYGYTLLAPYFELAPSSPAAGQTGYLPHPPGPGASAVAPVGGYVMGIPANLPPERAARRRRGAGRLHQRPQRRRCTSRTAAGRIRAIRWARTPRCGAIRRSSRPSTT